MKLSRILFLVALSANSVTLIAYYWVMNQPSSSGAGMIYVLFIFPGIWIAFVVIAIALAVSLRNKTGPDSSALRIIAFICCTPFPILSIAFGKYLMENRAPSLFTQSLAYRDHVAYKSETWTALDSAEYVQMFFTADSTELALQGESAFKKDSVWIYLDKQNDTLKVEFYRDDVLVRTIRKKSR
jgi:hypothetical protein